MREGVFKAVIVAAALAFLGVFALVVMPPLAVHPDVPGAFAAGFVNPYASGYSADVLACWVILSAWILFERRHLGIRHGWMCIVLGMVPGVAVGFAAYLLLRTRQRGAGAGV